MEGKAGPSTMSPLPSWQCQSSDEEEMSICSDFVTIMRCGCWIEQSHTYWNWTARYPFHSPSREFNHLHHHHHPHHHLLGWQCIEVSPHSWSHLRNGFIAGKQATASQCITLHHSASHCITVHHTAPQCITVHHTAPQCTTWHHIAPQWTTVHHSAPHHKGIAKVCQRYPYALHHSMWHVQSNDQHHCIGAVGINEKFRRQCSICTL